MSALKTAAWTGAAVVAATFIGSNPISWVVAGGIALFSAMKAWGSHKESQRESAMAAATQAHSHFVQGDRQRERDLAIQQAYGDRDTSVGWAEAEAAGRGVGTRGR